MRECALRVAIIGYGHAGSVFHAPLVAATPGLRVAAIVTRSAERRAQAQAEFPEARILTAADQVWDNRGSYDVVVVATPNATHFELGMAALQAGLPLVIDKPMAVCVEDARRLVATAQTTGVLLTVFHNARWSIPFLTARQVISSGVLGEITAYEARMERYRPVVREGAWRERGDPAAAGGLLFDLGSHLIDQALQLFGPVSEVYAELEHRRPGTEVDDDSFVSMRFANGVRARLWMSYLARLPGPVVRVAGLGGTYVKLEPDPQEPALRAGRRPGESDWGHEPPAAWGHLSADFNGVHVDGPIESARGGYEQFYALLRNALLNGGGPPVDARDALACLGVIEAAQESARRHAVITIPCERRRA